MTTSLQSYHVIPRSPAGQDKYLYQFKVTAILHLTCGIALVILGISAALSRAMWSFYAAPIWCGILFYIVPGIVGMCAAKQKKHHLAAAYIGLSVTCSVISFALFAFYCWIAKQEKSLGYINYSYCNPHNKLEFGCGKSIKGRMVVDVLIALISLLAFIASILGASYGSCFNCSCCSTCYQECCGDAPDCCTCCGQHTKNEVATETTAKYNPSDCSLRLQVVPNLSQPESSDPATKPLSGGDPV